MRNTLHLVEAVGLIVVLLAASAASATAEIVTAAPAAQSPAPVVKVPVEPDALYATGQGAMPTTAEQPNRAKAYLQAKGHAKMEAIANLIQEARGTAIQYRSNGRNYAAEEEISQEIKGVVNRVRVVSERKIQEGKDTIVEVKVRAPIPEDWRKASASDGGTVLSAGPATSMTSARVIQPSWAVASAKLIAPSSKSAARDEEGPFTSVIINTRGLHVARSMSPKIRRSDGSEVWGTVKVDYDFIADHGIVAYARGVGEARENQRAGDNPLVLRAIDRGDSPSRSDVVISDDDADRLLDENRHSGFLKEFRVIFVVDPSRF